MLYRRIYQLLIDQSTLNYLIITKKGCVFQWKMYYDDDELDIYEACATDSQSASFLSNLVYVVYLNISSMAF